MILIKWQHFKSHTYLSNTQRSCLQTYKSLLCRIFAKSLSDKYRSVILSHYGELRGALTLFVVASIDLYETLCVKWNNLSTKDRFLCDIFTCKGTEVVGHHQRSRTHQHRRKQTLLLFSFVGGVFFFCSFWGCFGWLVWGFFIYFETLLDAYNSVEKIKLTWWLQLKNNPTDFACSKSPKVKPFY